MRRQVLSDEVVDALLVRRLRPRRHQQPARRCHSNGQALVGRDQDYSQAGVDAQDEAEVEIEGDSVGEGEGAGKAQEPEQGDEKRRN